MSAVAAARRVPASCSWADRRVRVGPGGGGRLRIGPTSSDGARTRSGSGWRLGPRRPALRAGHETRACAGCLMGVAIGFGALGLSRRSAFELLFGVTRPISLTFSAALLLLRRRGDPGLPTSPRGVSPRRIPWMFFVLNSYRRSRPTYRRPSARVAQRRAHSPIPLLRDLRHHRQRDLRGRSPAEIQADRRGSRNPLVGDAGSLEHLVDQDRLAPAAEQADVARLVFTAASTQSASSLWPRVAMTMKSTSRNRTTRSSPVPRPE